MLKLLTKGPKFSPTVYKASLLAGGFAAFIVPLALVALPFVEFFNGMAAQPKLKAQSLFGRDHGLALMGEFEPPEGTVHREYVSHPFAGADTQNTETYQKVLDEAGKTLKNPIQPSMDVMRRGEQLYAVNCLHCHGTEGLGDGSVIGADRFPAPPSLHTDEARAYKDGALYQIIIAGKAAMPGHAERLVEDDRWAVVHYLRALQRSMNPKPEDLQP